MPWPISVRHDQDNPAIAANPDEGVRCEFGCGLRTVSERQIHSHQKATADCSACLQEVAAGEAGRRWFVVGVQEIEAIEDHDQPP
jgi:hypothetical protein